LKHLFGADEVAPSDQAKYTRICSQYGPLWKLLNPEANRKVRLGNYEQLFDEARRKAWSWESTHSTEKMGIFGTVPVTFPKDVRP
jgi:hypothetical protein